MLRIAIFTPTMESVILLSSLYKTIREEGHTPLFYDVVEEGGWFEKGIQYVSLGYPKPRKILRYPDYNQLNREVERIIEKEEIDVALLAGYSPATYKLLYFLKHFNIRTIHLEAGLRNYTESSEEALRQAIDWTSIYNVLPTKTQHLNLSQEGFPIEQMYITGSLYVDSVLTNLSDAVTKSSILEELDTYREGYVYSYFTPKNLSDYSIKLGEASLRWNIDAILPLKTRWKNKLKEAGIYYDLMSKYYVIPIEQVDYLDHLNLIYNSKVVITDNPRVSLESSILKKPVIFLDVEEDLYQLGGLKAIHNISKDRLSELSLDKYRGSKMDVKKLFGNGESRFRVLEAIEGFASSKYKKYNWKWLFVRKNGSLQKVKYSMDFESCDYL